MNIFVATRRILQLSGLNHFDCPHSFVLNLVQNVFILVICVVGVLSATIFTVNAIDYYKLKDLLDFLYMLATSYSIVCVHLNLMLRRPELFKCIGDLEVIVSTRAKISKEVSYIYAETSKFNAKLTKWSTALSAVCAIVFVAQWIVSSLWIIWSENHSVNELSLPYPLL